MERKSYSCDLTDDQWQTLQEHLPKAKNGRTGRKRIHPLREVVNGLFYQLKTGCPWRELPHDLPPWETVYDQFRRWRDNGTLECVHDALREKVRAQDGREPTPSAAIVDSQSVKTTEHARPVQTAQKGGLRKARRRSASRKPSASMAASWSRAASATSA
jgi:putative transposase